MTRVNVIEELSIRSIQEVFRLARKEGALAKARGEDHLGSASIHVMLSVGLVSLGIEIAREFQIDVDRILLHIPGEAT